MDRETGRAIVEQLTRIAEALERLAPTERQKEDEAFARAAKILRDMPIKTTVTVRDRTFG